MRILFIDTCTSHLRLAVIEEDKILAESDQELNKELSIKALPYLKDMLASITLKPNDIDIITVTTGPGSFTGIRMGVTIAKTYAWSLNKKIIPLSSLEVIASTKANSNIIVPIIDAKRESVYCGVYDDRLNNLIEDQYIAIDTMHNLLKKYPDICFVSSDVINGINTIKPKIDIIKIVKKHKFDDGINPHLLNPNYHKLTEAELKLNKGQ